MMKAGIYWVGDLCYAMEQDWDEFCALTISGNDVKDGEFELADGTKFAFRGTGYDGTYFDQEGRQYPVDAGLIGCILVSDIKPSTEEVTGGHIITFPNDFEVTYESGVISFGNVISIDTDQECGEEDYYNKDDVDIEGEDE
jgi:hypothetical protein